MSLFDCIQSALEQQGVDEGRAREAQRLFDRLRADYEARGGFDDAAAQAAADVKQIMAARVGQKRRNVMLRLTTARRNAAQLLAHRTLRGNRNPADALRVFITGDENSPITGIVPLTRTLTGFYHAEIDQVLATFGHDVTGGVRNKAGLQSFVVELFGGKSGDAAASELATAARRALEMARRDYNAAGGNVGQIENYGMPMHHSPRKVADAGADAWVEYAWGRLDWNRMRDFETDQPFAPPGALPPRGGRAEEVLRGIWSNISTSGWAKREASFVERGLIPGQSREASRVLHFRDGDAWLEYNRTFGERDPFSTLVGALESYAHDTAAMRVLGPNPKAGLVHLTQLVMKEAQERPWRDRRWAISEASTAAYKALAMLDLHSGAAAVPVNGMLAETLAGTRAVLVSAQLGSAALSGVSDVGFQLLAARQVGISRTKLLRRFATELATASPAQRARLGLIAERAASTSGAAARYVGEVWTPERAGRLSEFVMRASGLARWTDVGRHAFQLEFMGHLADQLERPWASVEPALKSTMERKGFTEADWRLLQAAPLHQQDGATFLVPQMIRYHSFAEPDVAEDLAFRVMSMIHEQTEFAVPSSSLEGQVEFVGPTRPGTFIGELAKSSFMYKSFGVSVLFNQARRVMRQNGVASKLAYFTAAATYATALGMVSLQLKELRSGWDLRPIDSWDDIGAAILQGGGLGIFGDFLTSEENRFGGGLASTLTGPVVGAAGDLLRIGTAAVQGEGSLGRNVVNFLRYNTPITGIWYWSAAFQRGLFDNLQRLFDPEAERAWHRAQQKRSRERGNDSWWPQGSLLPQRMPSFTLR